MKACIMSIFLMMMLMLTLPLLGQETDKKKSASDLKKIELRPNSREEGAVIRNNSHKRIDIKTMDAARRKRYIASKQLQMKKMDAMKRRSNQSKKLEQQKLRRLKRNKINRIRNKR